MLPKLSRQLMLFILVGLLLVVVDWAVFSLFFYLGMPLAPANILGRAGGACLGFYLNGRITFAEAGQPRLGRWRLFRFVVVWLVLTALGTLLMMHARTLFGAHAPYLAKPVIEAFLAGLGFLCARFVVYR